MVKASTPLPVEERTSANGRKEPDPPKTVGYKVVNHNNWEKKKQEVKKIEQHASILQ